ncbi:putative protein-lysine deacylase ABHD14B [Physella acuta]|uniref:putative protein-lysine deacylase ABHD14B n=1 Tax=Physella acuta TaxID=109671 RepID=UPI0027DCBFD3|nr:putative protein-lysine deacylase ABHD14B [Physella acuta]XP_059168255.1 putative protein-lysine deacylase ABHD14B [Physella acuta]XP_059168256.1 putative protein-lysine deacylase ABHD14B [Physella acuta]XP_059168257.1 putative protein-lysine deacylase ABHD14B [Physella acuta]XP_059168258.1 putative protein-lysine deacylase ABHD14B [Physella acuta]XP_059168259.1 putative protein-lysine deacylase ABHD14B [Physella acuta]
MAGEHKNKTLDYTLLDSPPQLLEDALVHESKTVEVTVGDKTLKIYTEILAQKDCKPKLDVLFLHGMSFTSKNWLDIKSVYHVANWGYRAVAVDLPGFGKSLNLLPPENDGEFLKSFISELGLKPPVIVSPSMSGSFSLPYLFDGDVSTGLERATAYVPVAPVNTSKYVKHFRTSKIPTMIVVGSKDLSIGARSTQDLKHIPDHWYAPIEGASHACYMNNPDAFHKLLFFFLKNLEVL